MNELTKELKDLTIKAYKRYGDSQSLVTKGRAYTGNEIASELENETEFGLEILGSLLSLSIDLIKRQKESLDEPKSNPIVSNAPPTRDGGDYVVKN